MDYFIQNDIADAIHAGAKTETYLLSDNVVKCIITRVLSSLTNFVGCSHAVYLSTPVVVAFGFPFTPTYASKYDATRSREQVVSCIDLLS